MNPMTRGSLTMVIGPLMGFVACVGCGDSTDQSPFEWRGLRAGMRFSTLNRLSQPGSAWKCNQFIRSAVGLGRTMGAENKDFGGGSVVATVDTVGQRVLLLHYSVPSTLPDTSRKAEFERELTALALKWDNMPGVIRHRASGEGPATFAAWDTRDSLWSARIYYNQSVSGPARPESLEIEERDWSQHLIARINESLKREVPNPLSPDYRAGKPNAACDVLLQSL